TVEGSRVIGPAAARGAKAPTEARRQPFGPRTQYEPQLRPGIGHDGPSGSPLATVLPTHHFPLVLLLLLLLEELENLRHSFSDDVPVAGAGDFHVLVRHAEFLQLVHPAPRSRGRRDGRQAGPGVRVFRPQLRTRRAAPIRSASRVWMCR